MINFCAKCVKIVLTFDDGPHTPKKLEDTKVNDSTMLKVNDSKTLKVRDTLREKGKIIAAFFIQTHVPHRMGSEKGKATVKDVYGAGHMIGIHTGSSTDHTLHPMRYKAAPYDINGDGVVDGENGLASDLQAAKTAIKKVTGAEPLYVRATGGNVKVNKSNAQIFGIYQKYDLVHVCWNVDSYDSKGKEYGTAEVKAQLQSNIKSVIGKGRRILVILFHDTDDHTPDDLASYIDTINETITGMNLVPEYTKSREEIESIFSVSNQAQWDEKICSGVQKLIVYYVQAGAYATPKEAAAAAAVLNKEGYVNSTVKQEAGSYKLWIGPYDDRHAAVREEAKIRAITRETNDNPPKKEQLFPIAAVIEREQ